MKTSSSAVDVAVLIALDEEYKPFGEATGLRIGEGGRFVFEDLNHQTRNGIVHCFADMGPRAAQRAAQKLIDDEQPVLVIVVGLAGQLDDYVRLGEVVVATEVDDYSYRGKAIPDPNDPSKFIIEWGGQTFPASSHPAKLLEALHRDNPKLFDKWRDQVAGFMKDFIPVAVQEQLREIKLFPPKQLLHKGPIASGPWVSASKVFKDILKTRNRNFLALEMESAAALSAAYDRETWPTTLVLRVVSDPADERKQHIDQLVADDGIRAWSLRNIYTLLELALRRLPLWHDAASPAHQKPARVEELHSRVSVEHLPNAYREELSPEMLAAIGEYVRVCGRTDSLELRAGSEWESIASEIYSSNQPYPLRVVGDSGSGKSTFLAALYWYLKHRSDTDSKLPVPVFLSALTYDEKLDDERGRRSTTSVQNDVNRDIEKIGDFVRAGHSIVAIIDGLDESARFRKPIEDALLKFSNTAKQKIVGISVDIRGEEEVRAILQNPQAALTLLPVGIDRPEAERVIQSFATVAGIAEHELAKRVRDLEIDTIDWSTLSMVRRSRMTLDLKEVPTLAEIYILWCKSERAIAARRDEDFLPLAQLAYDYTFHRDRIDHRNVDVADWRIVRTHENVRYCLVAWLVIECLISEMIEPERRQQILDRVYTFRVNRFCKDLIAGDYKKHERIIKKIRDIYPNASVATRTNLAYFAGRFDTDPARDAGRKLLEQWIPELTRIAIPSAQERMLIRTTYVSLSKYGDKKATAEYVNLMLRSRELDELNRGFHLEYYMDEPNYNPSITDEHRDHLRAYPKTADRLIRKIARALEAREPAREILDIEIHTICSLAQHRQAEGPGVLEETDRQKTILILKEVLKRNLFHTPQLRSYLTMAVGNLEDPTFTVVKPLERMFELKALPRAGWKRREINLPIESVAAHSFGGFLIGFFFLPDTLDDETYDKNTVLQMILLHDLGESVIGDLLRDEKTAEDRERERAWFTYLQMLSTYKTVGNLRDVERLFREFESGSSTNGKIAKDLDTLDQLFQLMLYTRRGATIDDREDWMQKSVPTIRTEEGNRIWELLRMHFHAEHDSNEYVTWWMPGPALPIRKKESRKKGGGRRRGRR